MQHLGRQRVGPLRYSGPPRPVPLPERPPQGKLRTDSTYDWREIGEQVTQIAFCRVIVKQRKHKYGTFPQRRAIATLRIWRHPNLKDESAPRRHIIIGV